MSDLPDEWNATPPVPTLDPGPAWAVSVYRNHRHVAELVTFQLDDATAFHAHLNGEPHGD